MDNERERKEVISNIRACLISIKGSVSLRQLETDYKLICGQRIPYTRLGFRTIQDFISSIPTLTLSKSPSGEYFVDAKVSEKSVHITDMVSKQKNGKKKPIVRAPSRPYRANTYVPPESKYSSITAKYKLKGFNVSERTTAVSHNQFVNRSPSKVKFNLPKYQDENIENVAPKKPISPPPEAKTKTPSPPPPKKGPFNGLTNTPLRANLAIGKEPITTAAATTTPTQTGSRLRTTNVTAAPQAAHRSPVDLETFSKSLVNSSRRRLTKMMSDVSMDRDSGNSSPVSDDKIQVSELLTGNAIEDLKSIVEWYKLGKVDIKNMVMKPKNKYAKPLHNCAITVDGQTYLSYPKEFYDEASAEVYCAQNALKELLPKCARRRRLLLSNSKDIKERIPPMLKVHAQGVWSSSIEEDYADLYFEQLPTNWLEIIDSCDCVAVERIQDDRYVLRYCEPGMVLQKGEKFGSILPPDVSIPSTIVQFGEGNRLCAQITCIMSLSEVWCQQIDTPQSEYHNEMISKMEAYYNQESEKLKAQDIQVGSYYIANYESNWYRVRALDVQEHQVNCFLIDFGDEYLIKKGMICNIRREFAMSPAQAFVCRLAGLEDLYDANDVPLDKLVSYVGKEVVLSEKTDADVSEADQIIAVDIYDITEGVSINKQLLEFLAIEMATPVIRQNTIDTVHISHLCDGGYVYIQIHSKGFASLQCLMQNIEGVLDKVNASEYVERLSRAKWEANKDRVYLSRSEGHWCRSRVLDMSPDGDLAQVYFIDVGSYKVVKVAEEIFYRLEEVSEVLCKFPPQAVMIKLALDAIPKNFVDLASGLLKPGSFVLMKVVGHDENGHPLGEFYRRSVDGGLLFINKSIAMEMEISQKSESSASKGTKSKLDKKLSQNVDKVPSAGSLMSPKLPEKGAYYGVVIPFTVNPWNFFVQPYNSREQLDDMMMALQERYKDTTCSSTQTKNIVPGQIFAAKHTDGIWYRTSVLKVIHSGSISVFYCDFGYYSNLSVSQLIPLDPEFTKLPYQALKAKLSGIKPKKSKWSMEDCEVFSELVKGKALISILIDIEKDELYESDPVLKLTLVDTSNDFDIFIDEELIKRNIAIKAD